MCERITFPVKVCESCVIHGELKLLERARRTASFSLGPRDKPKHLRRGEVCFLWETPLPPNCFCFSGSDVSCNHLGMRVCVTAVLLVPQQRRSFRLFAHFLFYFIFFLFPTPAAEKGQMLCICVWRAVVVSWTWCDFAGPFVWLLGPSRLEVFPPAGFQHTWCYGSHEILKKPFVISR